MNAWVAVAAAGTASFALRFVVVAAVDRVRLPDWFARFTAHVMPAAFAALAAAALTEPLSGSAREAVPVVAAAMATLGVGLRRTPHAAVATGMLTLWCADDLLALA